MRKSEYSQGRFLKEDASTRERIVEELLQRAERSEAAAARYRKMADELPEALTKEWMDFVMTSLSQHR